ncbi:MAG TPA: hypothetical protein VNE63_00505 [Candidatus Acidoferrales bacterium]|nr:hypothetical protein [Candidatus Acidoferrales bacterium]
MLSRGKLLIGTFYSVVFALAAIAGVLAFPSAASAQKIWYAQVGAESHDEAKQANAFLPNEIWIYAGDSITFRFSPKNEDHTVTLLERGQVRPLFSGPPSPRLWSDVRAYTRRPPRSPAGHRMTGLASRRIWRA